MCKGHANETTREDWYAATPSIEFGTKAHGMTRGSSYCRRTEAAKLLGIWTRSKRFDIGCQQGAERRYQTCCCGQDGEEAAEAGWECGEVR